MGFNSGFKGLNPSFTWSYVTCDFFSFCAPPSVRKSFVSNTGELHLALHLNYPFVYGGTFCTFLWSRSTAGLVYEKNVISMNCMCCELEYSWVSTRSSRSLIQIHRIFIRRNFYTNGVKCQENKKLVTAIGVVAWAIGLSSSTCSIKQMSL